MSLPTPLAQAWRAFADAANRLDASLAPAAPSTVDDCAVLVAKAEKRLFEELRSVERRLAAARDALADRGRTADDAAWKRLDSALNRVESELRSPPTLRMRMDEGRRSMMPRVEAVVRERLQSSVRVEGGRMLASVDAESVATLQGELPGWLAAWGGFVAAWVERDLDRSTREAWSPREGELPLPMPALPALVAPKLSSEVSLPVESIERARSGFFGLALRHGRGILFGVLSVSFVFGSAAPESLRTILAVLGMPVGAVAGAFYAAAERNREREKLEQELRAKSQAAVWESVTRWLERAADKMAEDFREQLFARREALVQWHRATVLPALEKQATAAAERNQRAESARGELTKLESRQREVQRVSQLLHAVRELADANPR